MPPPSPPLLSVLSFRLKLPLRLPEGKHPLLPLVSNLTSLGEKASEDKEVLCCGVRDGGDLRICFVAVFGFLDFRRAARAVSTLFAERRFCAAAGSWKR